MHLPDYNTASRSPSPSPIRRASSIGTSSSAGKGKARSGDELVQLDPLFLHGYGYPPHLVAATQGLDLSKASAKITMQEWAVGITPPGSGEEGEGKRVAGFFVCVSPSARRVKAIRITLCARLRLRLLDDVPAAERFSEDRDLVQREVSLGEESGGITLDKGVSVFEFGFDIPADSPTSERCDSGSIAWTVRGLVEGSGTRLLRSDLNDKRDLWIMPWPAHEDSSVLQLSHHVECLMDSFGPVSVDVSANELLVASALYVSIKMPAPSSNLVVYAVKVYARQTISHASGKQPGKVVEVLDQKRIVLQEGAMSGFHLTGFAQVARDRGEIVYDARERLARGETNEWELTRFGRLPAGDDLRPTTQPGTKSPLRFQPELGVEVVFSDHDPSDNEPEVVRVATMYNQKLNIGSCLSIFRSLLLPTYADDEVQAHIGVKDLHQNFMGGLSGPCKCETPWDTLLNLEKEAMARDQSAAAAAAAALAVDRPADTCSGLQPTSSSQVGTAAGGGGKDEPSPAQTTTVLVVRKAGETYEVGSGKRRWTQPKSDL